MPQINVPRAAASSYVYVSWPSGAYMTALIWLLWDEMQPDSISILTRGF
jgi:hypothetical protein